MSMTGIEILASVGKNLRTPGKKNNGTAADTSKDKVGADIGDALRSAYDEAVSEDIPEEMLDLLGKLS